MVGLSFILEKNIYWEMFQVGKFTYTHNYCEIVSKSLLAATIIGSHMREEKTYILLILDLSHHVDIYWQLAGPSLEVSS